MNPSIVITPSKQFMTKYLLATLGKSVEARIPKTSPSPLLSLRAPAAREA
ncbi:MAG: hypothetical protein ACO2OQ_01195 [Thermofilaceae archaeon]|jgi:hypothetical protein